MPLYDYLCPECDHFFEEFFKLHENSSEADCPECNSIANKVFISPVSLHGECGDYERKRFPYYDESLDVNFFNMKQKKKYLKHNNLRIKDPGERFKSGREKAKYDPNAMVMNLDADNKNDFNKKIDEKVREKLQQRRR